MSCYRLTAELLSPLLVQENRQSMTSGGLPYLPGSTLRGAFAAAYLRTGGSADDAEFRDLFLDSPVSFPDLFPAAPDTDVRPMPRTVVSCKRFPGFSGAGGHGVDDALASIVANRLRDDGLSELAPCTQCGNDVKPYSGFWNGDVAAPKRFSAVMTYQRHTGVDRLTGTAAASVFYVSQAMADGYRDQNGEWHPQLLSGTLYLDDHRRKLLADLSSDSIFAGADRVRGFGELKASLAPAQPQSFKLSDWDQAFKLKLAQYISSFNHKGLLFSIGLLSHAILVDKYLQPSSELDLGFPDVFEIARAVDDHVVRGWNAGWRLPKHEDPALARGGVIVFSYRGDDVDGLVQHLKKLTVQGIGLRRSEGFGRIIVCEPLHHEGVI